MLTGISHLALSTCDTVVVRDKVRLDVQMLLLSGAQEKASTDSRAWKSKANTTQQP
jgi:hypothetical protein